MGAVTACYALGASISPTVYKLGLARGGISSAMNLASLIFIATAGIVFLLLRYSDEQYVGEEGANKKQKHFYGRPEVNDRLR